MCPKIHTEKKEYESPEEVQALKILISTGDSYFKIQSLKVGINRQPLNFFKFYFFHVDGANKSKIGKISRRPISMSRDNTIFDSTE